MTKWARMRRRKERKRAEEASRRSETEGKEVKLAKPENISENTQQRQKIEKIEDTKTSGPNTVLSQIPRYVYLLAFFALLAGIFTPLITYEDPSLVIQGVLTLSLGLAGAILLFKGITSDERRGIFVAIGFGLISVSLVLIFALQEHAYL